MPNINSDIYNLSDVIYDIQKRFFEETDEQTLAAGLNGAINAIFAKQMQTNLQIVSEQSNEVFPTRARFEKNVIAHAYANQISNIEAVPAKIQIQLALNEDDVEKLLESSESDSFTIDKDLKFFIGEFEFHLDYDMIITKKKLSSTNSVYTAMYDMTITNSLSDITNPNLTSPYVIPKDGKRYIFIQCQLRQVEHLKYYEKVLTSNNIENKTFEFEFENQLAAFDVFVAENGTTTKLTPVFESSPNELVNYCKFNYSNSNRIRVMFDSDSYMPSLNAEITAYIKTTHGAAGNFEYTSSVMGTFDSTDKFDYGNLEYFFTPTTNSIGGSDKRTVEELRKLLPKEALSRGVMVIDSDLNNYFNSLNSSQVRMSFVPKVDNQFMRSYYCYLVLKDKQSNMVPTNTIPIDIKENEFDLITDANNASYKTLILKQGCKIGYYMDENSKWRGVILKNETQEFNEELASKCNFFYTLPYKCLINYALPSVSYYLNIMNETYPLSFSYINMNSPLQFISANAFWTKNYISNNNKYILRFKLLQNILSEAGIVTYRKNGDDIEVVDTTLKVVALFYNADGAAYRYLIGEIESYDPDNFVSTFKFELSTNDVITPENEIRINDLYILNSQDKEYGVLPQNCKVEIYVLNKFDGQDYGILDISNYLPSEVTDGYTLTNKYTIINGLTMFDDFTDIVSSIVTIDERDKPENRIYKLQSVPVIGYDFAQNEESVKYMASQMKEKKQLIDNGINRLNYQFSVDFKLFNTYGPGVLFSTNPGGNNPISRVNLSLVFNTSLRKQSDDYTKDYIIRDIKAAIEDIDNISDLHFPNLVSEIYSNYSNSIYFLEFVGFNLDNGDPIRYQHIYYNSASNLTDIPECLCINTNSDGTPDITINVV